MNKKKMLLPPCVVNFSFPPFVSGESGEKCDGSGLIIPFGELNFSRYHTERLGDARTREKTESCLETSSMALRTHEKKKRNSPLCQKFPAEFSDAADALEKKHCFIAPSV